MIICHLSYMIFFLDMLWKIQVPELYLRLLKQSEHNLSCVFFDIPVTTSFMFKKRKIKIWFHIRNRLATILVIINHFKVSIFAFINYLLWNYYVQSTKMCITNKILYIFEFKFTFSRKNFVYMSFCDWW